MAWHSGKPADGDFLSASVRHIRENFAELEPLHPHVAELVDLTTLHPHAAELVDLTALHPHVAALLDSRIVEMGSNANGEYVRWENGLQVCAFIHPGGISVDPQSYAYYDWTPPAEFVEFYAVLMVPYTLGGDPNPVSLTYGVLGINRRAVLRNNASISRTMFPQFIAIGRWK